MTEHPGEVDLRTGRRLRRLVVGALALALVPTVPALAQEVPPTTPSTTSTSTSTSSTSSTTSTTATTQPSSTTSSSSSTTSTTAAPDATTSTTVPEDPAAPPAPPPAAPIVPGALAPEQVSAIRDLRDELEDVTDSERDFFDRLLASQSLIDNLNLEIANLDLDLLSAEQDLARAEAGLAQTQARVADLDGQLSVATDEYDEARGLLRAWAVEAYIAGGTEPPPAALLSARDPSELNRTVTYADALVVDSQHAIADVVGLRQRTRALADEARQQRDAVQLFRDQADEHRTQLAARRDQQLQARSVVEGAVVEQRELLLETAERRAEYERRVAAEGQVSDGISGTLAAAQADQPDAIFTSGIFVEPIPGAPIVSLFGPRVHPIYGVSRMHNGIDLDATLGTPIRAPGDGKVLIAAVQGGYGNCVVIDHGNGIGTLYGHMSVLAVTAGQDVRQGDILGAVGSTGLSTGPHLHFEVRLRGQPIDPRPYLGLTG